MSFRRMSRRTGLAAEVTSREGYSLRSVQIGSIDAARRAVM